MRPNAPLLALLFLLSVVGGYVACGDDDDGGGSANIQEYCDVFCGKLEECGSAFASQCATQCPQIDPTNECTATSSQVDACLDAVRASTCADVEAGNVPEACDFCDDGGNDTGSADMGGGSDSGGGDACQDLSSCCTQLPAGEQKTGCEATVTSGATGSCSAVLQAFQSQNLCN